MVDFRNPNGAVCIVDGGVPRTITIKARADISGGYWVNGSSAAGVVGSGADTYVASDIEGYPVATQIGSEVIGLAIKNIASGTYGAIATRGMFLLPGLSGTKIGSIFAGNPLLAGSAGTVLPLGSSTLISVPGAAAKADMYPIGRAFSTGGADGEFVIVSLNL
jgi:predicted RecA/RadA family phage recombinase